MEDPHHALGCVDGFQQMERAGSNPSGDPTPSFVPATCSRAHTSGLMRQNQSSCDSASPASSSRGPKFIGLNQDVTQSYSLHFQTGSRTFSKRKACDTEVSRNMRYCQLTVEMQFQPYSPFTKSDFTAHRGVKQKHRPDRAEQHR